jgi:hypothetical protein
MRRKFLSILGITLMIALFIPQIIFAENYDVNEDSYIDEKSSAWEELLARLHIDKLEVPIIGGTGCRTSDSIGFGPSANGFVIKFHEYVAKTDNSNYTDSKTCDITLPIKMKEGYRIGIGKVRYNGEADIPYGGSGKLRREYFFGTDYGKVREYYVPKKGQSYDFIVQDGDSDSDIVWSECGGWVDANIYTLIRATRPKYSYATAKMSLKAENATLMIEPLTEPCQ